MSYNSYSDEALEKNLSVCGENKSQKEGIKVERELNEALIEIETLKSKIESLYQLIEPIQYERDAVEAQMELMRDALKSVRDYGSSAWDEWLVEKADKALEIPEGAAAVKLKYVAGADALEQFANELVQIHNVPITSKSVVFAKEKAKILYDKANWQD